MREIDITKEPINCIDELITDEEKRSIEATYELWMDVDKYFGTKTRTDSSIWVNFYTFWHLDNPAEITAQMVLNGDNSCEEKEWELTKEEKEFFCKMMEDYCVQKNGCTLREFFEKYGHFTSEV